MPSRDTKQVVEFSHVGVRIESNRILSEINFTVNKGEKRAIVGPNSSGKTTLLRIVNGYLGPSNGEVTFRGEIGEVELDGIRKQTGFVSSSPDRKKCKSLLWSGCCSKTLKPELSGSAWIDRSSHSGGA
jgi:ABC-type molybdenum transport system ATPase subunit/photorepair protein PhrA